MQNRYVGDIGDFGKYGLLKSLCSEGEPRDDAPRLLGVIWYLVPDENHNGDGNIVQFLNPSAKNQELFRSCDHALYDALRDIVESGNRNVGSIKDRGVLPNDTKFFETPLKFGGLPGPRTHLRQQRLELRARWLNHALRATADCDIVFLDPDNGIEVRVEPHQPRGPKYTYLEEMRPFIERGQSLVIYHHIARHGSANEQTMRRLHQIEEQLNRRSFALLYHRGSARAFFVIPAEPHVDTLLYKAERFLESPWRRHFELVAPD